MSDTTTTDPRYPVGKFPSPKFITAQDRAQWMDEIAAAPAQLRAALAGLTPEQQETPYRDGGWTLRQVAHHVPDSHMNAFIRIKFALTETDPLIKPYDEAAWARLGDVAATPVETSLALLEALHVRWVLLLRGMTEADWQRCYVHPEMGKISLERALAIYAWHGRHHVAHVTELRRQKAW